MPYDFGARFSNADLMACCKIAASAYDLFEIFFAYIDYAHFKRVSIRMRIYFFYFSDNYVVELS